jgi:hypothetical protein
MVLAPALASLALFAGGERVCQGQIDTDPPPRPSALEIAISYRRAFGFRADRAYVRRVQRTGRTDPWLEIPLTRRESRYIRMRFRIQNNDDREIRRYLAGHPELSGGVSIEDDWPREPYLLVRVTRDQAAHEAALKRIYRYPDNLRTALVEHSYDELRRVQDTIDFDAHRADGFWIATTSPNIERNRVLVRLMTARTDHAEYFAGRYGPLVATEVIATEPTRLRCSKTLGYRLSRSGRSLRLWYESGGGARLEQVELRERARRVHVGVVERVSNGPITADLRIETRTIRLRRPLGDRRVVDAGTGQTVRRLTCRRLRDCDPLPRKP